MQSLYGAHQPSMSQAGRVIFKGEGAWAESTGLSDDWAWEEFLSISTTSTLLTRWSWRWGPAGACPLEWGASCFSDTCFFFNLSIWLEWSAPSTVAQPQIKAVLRCCSGGSSGLYCSFEQWKSWVIQLVLVGLRLVPSRNLPNCVLLIRQLSLIHLLGHPPPARDFSRKDVGLLTPGHYWLWNSPLISALCGARFFRSASLTIKMWAASLDEIVHKGNFSNKN